MENHINTQKDYYDDKSDETKGLTFLEWLEFKYISQQSEIKRLKEEIITFRDNNFAKGGNLTGSLYDQLTSIIEQ